MKENIIRTKSFLFAIRMVKLSQYLNLEKKEFVLAKQIIRSGTSIGALVREAEQAESSKDFVHKMYISIKEANETKYWLELLKETNYLTIEMFQSINLDCEEIIKILTSIIKTSKIKIEEKIG